MSDYKLKTIELIESDITGYQVFKDTGLSQTVALFFMPKNVAKWQNNY